MNRILFLLTIMVVVARANIDAPIPEITLLNGKTYKNFEIRGFTENVFSAKWDGGRGTFPYRLLPDDIRVEAEKQRPGSSTSDSTRPSDSQLSLARQRSTQERRMVTADRKIKTYETALRENRKPTMLQSEYEEAKIEYRDAKMKFDELSHRLH